MYEKLIKRIEPFGEILGLKPDEIATSFKEALKSGGDLGLDRAYSREIGYFVYQLNNATEDAEKEVIVQKLQFLNTLYLAVKGEEIETLALLTRHLECDRWEQKTWGFTPNAEISAGARAAMKAGRPKEHTHSFLYDNEFGTGTEPYKETSLRVEVSPVDRAQESATHILPQKMKNKKNTKISIQDYLGEISHAVSGFAVKSNQELQDILEDQGEKIKGDKSLKQRATMNLQFPVSKVVYGDTYFEGQKEKRENVLGKLRRYGNHEISWNEDTREVQYVTEADKIKSTMEHINDTEEKNLWLVYHQKNSRRFLEEALGMKDVYTNYGETRHVFKLKSKNDAEYDCKLFTPPYVLTIDQTTGKIGARFAPECLKLSEKIKLKKNEAEHDIEAEDLTSDQKVDYGFREILPEVQIYNKEEISEYDYFSALSQLEFEIEEADTPESVKQSVSNFVKIISNLKSQGEFSDDELPTITRYIQDTTTLIQDSKVEKSKYYNSSFDNYKNNIEQAMETKRKWGQIVGGALLCIVGALTVAAAITLTVLTCGAGSPLTLPAAAAGAFAVAAGVAACTGVVAGVVGAKMIQDEGKKRDIATAMDDISISIHAEKTKTFKERLASDKESTQDLDISGNPGTELKNLSS